MAKIINKSGMKNTNKPYHIVFTTIFNPEKIVSSLYANIKMYGHLDLVKLWIVGDKRTPSMINNICTDFNKKGFEVIYLDIDKQDNWGLKHPQFYYRIPFNNETRRNIGYLFALEDECKVLISIDDDNFPSSDDFIGLHSKAGLSIKANLISENNSFHNICEYLQMEPSREVFPRGYPFKLRGSKNQSIVINNNVETRIGLIAGLWLEEPDVDATTWLNGKISVVNYIGDNNYLLDQDTWTPINTQNTSVVNELIPAYFCIPMGWDVPGGKIQRYGDIWGGYFFQALIKGLKFNVSFGRPLVLHKRNPHDYIDDIRYEFWGMILTDWLVDNLKNNFKPEGIDIIERVFQLSEYIKEQTYSLPKWCPEEMKNFLYNTSGNLQEWGKVCQSIRG